MLSAEDDLGRVGKPSTRRMQLSNKKISGYNELILCFTRVWLKWIKLLRTKGWDPAELEAGPYGDQFLKQVVL